MGALANQPNLVSTQDSTNIPVLGTGVNVNSTGAASSTTITIPALPGQLAYLSSFEIYCGGATAGAILACTITGLAGGTKTIPIAAPAGVTLAAPYTWVAYDNAIPASAVNTAIVLTIPAAAGRTNCAGTLQGFYL
jgi:hypothetical protein